MRRMRPSKPRRWTDCLSNRHVNSVTRFRPLAPTERLPAPGPRNCSAPICTSSTKSATTANASIRAIRWCSSWKTTSPSRGSCWTRRASRDSRGSSPRKASRHWRSPASSSRRPSRSTSSCPTSTAGACSNRIKNDAATRHIPVAVISTEESRELALDSGAHSFVAKPIQSKEALEVLLRSVKAYAQRATRNLVVVSTSPQMRDWFEEYLKADDVDISVAADYQARQGGGPVAWGRLSGAGRRCAGVGDISTARRRRTTSRRWNSCPCSSTAMPSEAWTLNGWRALARSSTVREIRTPERLLDQASFFLHRNFATMPESHRMALGRLHDADRMLPRQARHDRRRRHAQHLRADVTARGTGHGRGVARQRARRDPPSAGPRRYRHRADGHHDAGDRRHRDHPGDPQDSRAAGSCRSSPSRPRR